MDSIHTRINENTPTEKSVGVNLCFLHIKFRLSVGAFFERPRTNTVRPYRALYNFSDKNITHSELGSFLYCILLEFFIFYLFRARSGKAG